MDAIGQHRRVPGWAGSLAGLVLLSFAPASLGGSPTDPPPPPAPAVADVPAMGRHTTWTLRKDDADFVVELSGLCLSRDGDFLWGVGDNGHLYKIHFDGTYETHSFHGADMEGIAIDPETGDLYVAIEPGRVCRMAPPYTEMTPLFTVDEASSMCNSGIEGIAWHRGGLYLGAQTGATLWEYSAAGAQLGGRRSLRDIAPSLSEIADLCYDPVADRLWAIDSNANENRPPYLPYTIYLFDGGATTLLATYPVGDFANWNPETVCVDRKHRCLWLADDCGDDAPSRLHKVEFSGL